jgi:hypothetical protein
VHSVSWLSFRAIARKHGKKAYDALWSDLLGGKFEPGALIYDGPGNDDSAHMRPPQLFIEMLRQQAPWFSKPNVIPRHLKHWHMRVDAYEAWLKRYTTERKPRGSVEQKGIWTGRLKAFPPRGEYPADAPQQWVIDRVRRHTPHIRLPDGRMKSPDEIDDKTFRRALGMTKRTTKKQNFLLH